ncbi:hypothetical protein KCU72_g77, partial [Aureobasidium melanogenum]
MSTNPCLLVLSLVLLVFLPGPASAVVTLEQQTLRLNPPEPTNLANTTDVASACLASSKPSGCHGLCTVQTTFLSNKSAANEEASNASSLKSSPLARDPRDRPARFISPMSSKIMPNGRRGEKSTLPRFSRRRVAAEYKRPRSPLALVEHPSRRAGRSRGTLFVQPYSLEQANRTSLRNVIRDSKPSTLADHRFSTCSLDHLFSINHQPKQKLKRQVKYGNLRHEFENDGHLAEEARSTLEANEAQIIVQAKEKSFMEVALMVGCKDKKIEKQKTKEVMMINSFFKYIENKKQNGVCTIAIGDNEKTQTEYFKTASQFRWHRQAPRPIVRWEGSRRQLTHKAHAKECRTFNLPLRTIRITTPGMIIMTIMPPSSSPLELCNRSSTVIPSGDISSPTRTLLTSATVRLPTLIAMTGVFCLLMEILTMVTEHKFPCLLPSL